MFIKKLKKVTVFFQNFRLRRGLVMVAPEGDHLGPLAAGTY